MKLEAGGLSTQDCLGGVSKLLGAPTEIYYALTNFSYSARERGKARNLKRAKGTRLAFFCLQDDRAGEGARPGPG